GRDVPPPADVLPTGSGGPTPPRPEAGDARGPVPHPGGGRPARPRALPLDPAPGGQRLPPPCRTDEGAVHPVPGPFRVPLRRRRVAPEAPRGRRLAPPLLRAYDRGRGGLRAARGLHPLQPRQTRPGDVPPPLAIFEL